MDTSKRDNASLDGEFRAVRAGKELSKNDINAFANTFAVSFEGYVLFDYFLNGKYDVDTMRAFWRTSFTTIQRDAYFITDSEQMNCTAVILPNSKSNASFFKYLIAGGVGLLFKPGVAAVLRMLRFEEHAERIRNKYDKGDCWYFYLLATVPEGRGRGYGSKMLRTIIDFVDASGRDCYLETLTQDNVRIYEKFGFELMESVKIPDSDMTLYAMLRAGKRSDAHGANE